jgi:hypothetical protein
MEEYCLLGCDTIIWYVITYVAYAVSQLQDNYTLQPLYTPARKHQISLLPANKIFVLKCKVATLHILTLHVSFLMNFCDCRRINGSQSTVLYEIHTRAVRKVSSHFEYLENWSRGLVLTWQPVRGDLTVHP